MINCICMKVLQNIIKIKLRAFKSSEHVNEKGDGPAFNAFFF